MVVVLCFRLERDNEAFGAGRIGSDADRRDSLFSILQIPRARGRSSAVHRGPRYEGAVLRGFRCRIVENRCKSGFAEIKGMQIGVLRALAS